MPEIRDLEVDFKKYCAKCVHRNLNEAQEPCNTCLDYPLNQDSTKPINFKEKT